MLELEKIVIFGSVEGHYDVVVKPEDTDKVVHELKKRYEPVKG